MKTHRNAERLIGYLRELHQPVPVGRVAIAGVMNRRDASDAMQYGVRQGVIERIKVPGASARERVLYRLTGQQRRRSNRRRVRLHLMRYSRPGALLVCHRSYPQRCRGASR